jgi:hypothetical protein
MTYKQLFELLPKLDSLKNLTGAQFAYTVIYNKKLINEEYKIYEEMIKPMESYLQYDKERVEICMKYSDKDENNKPIINNNAFQITQNLDDFKSELELLNNKYSEAIRITNEQNKSVSEFLTKECDTQFKIISNNSLPKDISVEQLEIIMDWIVD